MTMDEIWRVYCIEEGVLSVHTDSWASRQSKLPAKAEDWSHIRHIRDTVTPALETKRVAGLIGASLDAKMYLRTENAELARILNENWKDLPRVLIVSQAFPFNDKKEGDEEMSYSFEGIEAKIFVRVEKADGQKCVRCWNYSEIVGTDAEHPGLCGKCLEAVK